MTLTINNDGTITATLSAQEQQMAQLVLADKGASVLSPPVDLMFQNVVRDVFNGRFAKLSSQDKGDILTKMAAAQ